MTGLEIVAIVMIGLGVLSTIIAAIGLERFDHVLMRAHATLVPASFGMMMILGGSALLIGSWAVAGMFLLVQLAQMTTVPIATTMVGRASFRRGFVAGEVYAFDELSPRLTVAVDDDDEDDGFVDELVSEDSVLSAETEREFPSNEISPSSAESDLSGLSNWDEPESDSDDEDAGSGIDIDLEDETETELEDVAERRSRRP